MYTPWASWTSGYQIDSVLRAALGVRREALDASCVLRAGSTLLTAIALVALIFLPVLAEAPDEESAFSKIRAEDILPLDDRTENEQLDTGEKNNPLMDPEAAKFDTWESLASEEMQLHWDLPNFSPIACFHDIGFRHSSTHGRNIGRGIPLTHSSWSNRPYHVDWFLGGMLNSSLIRNRVRQNNDTFGGVRIGWDFDHYWGTEWRFGWSSPNIDYRSTSNNTSTDNRLFITDFDLVYYPWGDSKIRPYALMGLGFTRVDFYDENDVHFGTSLLTMPYGVGLQFPMWPWLTWRLEVLNNLAFGADQVTTLANVSFTLGMEWRLGAKPSSYWPWRSSRYIW
jgi:hypothetical protein